MLFLIAGNDGVKSLFLRQKLKLVLALSGAAIAILLWSIYLWLRCGDPLAYSHAQAAWGRHFTWPWESFFYHHRWDIQVLSIYTLVLLLFAGIAMISAKKSDKYFVAINAIFPLITGNLNSYYRFFAVILPAFESMFQRMIKYRWFWMPVLLLLNLISYWYWVSYSGWLSF